MSARDDLNERGFAGAVLAEQRMHLARWRSNETPLSARTAWNDFVMSLSWSSGGACIYETEWVLA